MYLNFIYKANYVICHSCFTTCYNSLKNKQVITKQTQTVPKSANKSLFHLYFGRNHFEIQLFFWSHMFCQVPCFFFFGAIWRFCKGIKIKEITLIILKLTELKSPMLASPDFYLVEKSDRILHASASIYSCKPTDKEVVLETKEKASHASPRI